MITNDLLIAVALFERIMPLLKFNTREMISRPTLITVKRMTEQVLAKSTCHTQDPLYLTPMCEVGVVLDNFLGSDSTETDAETKDIIIERLSEAQQKLYLIAGKFYMQNDFEYQNGYDTILNNIVDNCIDQGFYFGYNIEEFVS